MHRRSFLIRALLTPLAAAAAAWLQACGGDDTMLATSASCDGRAPTIGVASNHTHPACVPMATLNGGAAYTLTLQATTYAPHTHTFALSAAEVTNLQTGGTLSGISSVSSSHQHTVDFL